jgi:hypothetical protein
VVHAVDDGAVHVVAARRGDQHALGAAGEMRAGLGLAGEDAGALEHHVDAQLAPGQLGRIALGEHADAVAIDHHRVAIDRDGAVELAVRGVVARQVRIGVRVAQVVDRHDLDLARALRFIQRAQRVAADAPVTIDANLDRH